MIALSIASVMQSVSIVLLCIMVLRLRSQMALQNGCINLLRMEMDRRLKNLNSRVDRIGAGDDAPIAVPTFMGVLLDDIHLPTTPQVIKDAYARYYVTNDSRWTITGGGQ